MVTRSATDPAKVSLCVSISRSQASSVRGKPEHWTVSAWTLGGNVPDATIRLTSSSSRVPPEFSFGCGTYDGTASCDLGAMDAKSAVRQLQALTTVPVSASAVTSVSLTVTGSAAHLPKDPAATATVTVTAPPPGTPTPGSSPTPTISPLPVGTLPYIPVTTPVATPVVSPGGNAGSLFPALNPATGKKAAAHQVANVSALPGGASVIGAQLVGLGALALAFVLAVTRLSIRRRPVPSATEAANGDVPAADTEGSSPDANETPGNENAPEE